MSAVRVFQIMLPFNPRACIFGRAFADSIGALTNMPPELLEGSVELITDEPLLAYAN